MRVAGVLQGRLHGRLMALSETLGDWIHAAQTEGSLNPGVPPEVVLYTLFSLARDPVLGMLKAGGALSARANRSQRRHPPPIQLGSARYCNKRPKNSMSSKLSLPVGPLRITVNPRDGMMYSRWS